MMIPPPRGMEPDKQFPTTGRLRLPSDLSVYLGCQQKTARVRRIVSESKSLLPRFLQATNFVSSLSRNCSLRGVVTRPPTVPPFAPCPRFSKRTSQAFASTFVHPPTEVLMAALPFLRAERGEPMRCGFA
jgi:hypothetical protein